MIAIAVMSGAVARFVRCIAKRAPKQDRKQRIREVIDLYKDYYRTKSTDELFGESALARRLYAAGCEFVLPSLMASEELLRERGAIKIIWIDDVKKTESVAETKHEGGGGQNLWSVCHKCRDVRRIFSSTKYKSKNTYETVA